MKPDTYTKAILTVIALCLLIIVLVLTKAVDLSPKESSRTNNDIADVVVQDTTKEKEQLTKVPDSSPVINPKKEVIDISGFNVGDRYKGGLVIRKRSNELLICSPKPIGAGGWDEGRSLCKKYKKGGLKWRLPTPTELELVFSMRKYLDHYELNWYWTNNANGGYAEHIGIQRGDHMFVPKEHGKYVFAVTIVKGE